MKQLLIILIILVISSCKTIKESSVTIIDKTYKDSSGINITFSPRILPIPIPKDSIKKETEIIYRDSCFFSPMFAYGKFSWAKAWSYKGKANIYLHEGGMVYKFKYDSAQKEVDRFRFLYESEKEKKETVKVTTQNSKFASFAIAFFWSFIAIIIIGVILSILFVRIKK